MKADECVRIGLHLDETMTCDEVRTPLVVAKIDDWPLRNLTTKYQGSFNLLNYEK